MAKTWLYKGTDPAEINELYSVGEETAATEDEPAKVPVLRAFKAALEPGQTFLAPDDWVPVPDPHPLFEPSSEAPKVSEVSETPPRGRAPRTSETQE